MPWGELGAVLLVLLAVFAVGQIWFRLVEGVLERLKKLVCRKEPPAWHPLPREDGDGLTPEESADDRQDRRK